MNIVLVGAPASGKGTQAKRISQKYNLLHISTGQLLRDIISEQDELSFKIESYTKKGKLVPDNLILEILKNYLTQNNKFDGILFDGFPRTLNQAEKLSEMLKVNYCFEIGISLETAINRVENRYFCESCNRTYIMSQHQSEFCVCGNKLSQREDDTQQTATTRYNDYLQIKNNIVEFYKNQNIYHYIDGEKTANEVFEQICKILK